MGQELVTIVQQQTYKKQRHIWVSRSKLSTLKNIGLEWTIRVGAKQLQPHTVGPTQGPHAMGNTRGHTQVSHAGVGGLFYSDHGITCREPCICYNRITFQKQYLSLNGNSGWLNKYIQTNTDSRKKTHRYIYISLFIYLETGSYYTILAGLESPVFLPSYSKCWNTSPVPTTATWKLHFKNVIATLVLPTCTMSI